MAEKPRQELHEAVAGFTLGTTNEAQHHVGSQARQSNDAGDRADRSRQLCSHCGLQMTGQFVRALGGIYHLDCFRCGDCQTTVAAKFFPLDDPDRPGHQRPLCETDYFRRLNLLCHTCKGALRGSYITALDKKFHLEHFTCSICPTVFGAQDSYYEHEGNVLCHYHFSLKFAQKCYGCQTSILKQFVEIQRHGVDQHWHPECYMIQKFWNVKLASRSEEERLTKEFAQLPAEEAKQREAQMEEKVNQIWNVLSGFEESSAACISDMLLNVSNGAYIDGVLVAVKFIAHVEVLFSALDHLEAALVQSSGKGLPYSREAKMLCKKVIAFFTLLAKTQEVGVRKLGITQELLSLVTGLAHYLKLLIRISLTGSLKLERDRGDTKAVGTYLTKLDSLSREAVAHSLPSPYLPENGVAANTDQQRHTREQFDECCFACRQAIDEACVKTGPLRFHLACMRCAYCHRDLQREWSDAQFNRQQGHVTCAACASARPGSRESFVYVSRLSQYIFLLHAALSRLYGTLKTGHSLPHTSDPNLKEYDSSSGHGADLPAPGKLQPEGRSKSFDAEDTHADGSASYATTLNDIRRLRSTHMKRPQSTQPPKARQLHHGDERGPSDMNSSPAELIDDQTSNGQVGGMPKERSITFDDLSKLVQTEQQKQKRPISFLRKPKGKPGSPLKKSSSEQLRHEGDLSGPDNLRKKLSSQNESMLSLGMRTKTYFSELSALEAFIVRHIAVLSLEPLVRDYYNMEELLDLIETRKGGFWGKFGKAFKPPKDEKKTKKKGTFEIPLEMLVERNAVESTLGNGPGQLRIPDVVDDLIMAMKGMDMSIEGVFRKNGNIRRLKDLSEAIDKGSNSVNFAEETPVQLAALLKKFLRDLPDPLMTFKLHKLFVLSQRHESEEVRYRIMHLTCCLLPKAHRDTLEVVLSFLAWVAQFAHVDEESGSKMDEHNLATVVAPNILYSRITNGKANNMDDSFAAIEAVYAMIKYSEEFSVVPDDLMTILADTSLFSGSADLTTKDILKRCEEKLATRTAVSSHTVEAITRRPQDSQGTASSNASSATRPALRVESDSVQLEAATAERSARQHGNWSQPVTPVTTHSSPRKAARLE
ncbi:hypothetical protein BCR37DRAFT_22697 [Protomyces lactucae-debilis]|uniref:Uncharacterized protein n=1 Tax=Protomyces lactucae-debilis TaxID=2754530 RepID=A0A1Y2FDA4_PROLT|nr:uncharacterized protein BCR37DRAFT_22697 [Protomyces lactucae-debilis]ORY81899.1 hypothetical protein BCR37DRAFT_22697 [Protomyces lactucae-debilis]